MADGVIKVMPTAVSRRISAGQGILDPANIVKELLENSLDAGATNVEIRLKDDGATGIEVIDDGTGIDSSNFDLLMKQHCTSKLGSFEDLERVATFGFRGEALASLCTIATVTIITRTASMSAGERLVYEAGATLRERSGIVRDRGTTVLVEELFKTLPVRAQEFSKHAKRELGKIQALVQAYALYSPNVRLVLSNSTGSRPRQVLLTSSPFASLRDSVGSLLGGNVARSLLELKEEFASNSLSLHALVSRPDPSVPRSGSSQQFFYLNKRPIDFSRLARTVTDLFRLTAGVTFAPVLIVCITASPATYDINLTPDKRKVMFHDEDRVLDLIQTAFSRLFQEQAASRQLPTLAPLPPAAASPQSSVLKSSVTLSRGASTGSTLSASLTRSGSGGGSGGGGSFGSSRGVSKSESGGGGGGAKHGNSSMSTGVKRKADNTHRCTEEEADGEPNRHKAHRNDENDFAAHAEARDTDKRTTEELQPLPPSPSAGAVLDIEALTSALLDQDDLDADLHDEAETGGAATRQFRRAENAEEQLELMGRTFQRDNFATLEFIGQFNLAFLIARLEKNSLFIIDQHAADEKANYEHFCSSLRLQTQQLLAPVPIELSPADLALARAEMAALTACGFALTDDGTRLLISGFPLSGATELGIADFHELLVLLSERRSQESQCKGNQSRFVSTPPPRPRRVTTMLMSRACRRAVMIGDPLEPEHCRKIIQTLATLQHPWQCPHGRPTINFLADLVSLPPCTYTRRPPS